MINKTQNSSLSPNGSAIAIGNFDGFHLGHKKIIDSLKQIAREKQLESMIITFSPNPKLYFKRTPNLINTDEQKKLLLESQGVDRVEVVDFPSVMNMTDVEFLQQYLIGKFNVKHMVMGENFRFGKQREGDIRFLDGASKEFGFQYTVATPVMLDGVRISSSRIRKQLRDGKIAISNLMLGRDYFIEGVVAQGERVGRKIGFPTININSPNTLLPHGVFKTQVQLDGELLDAITYIGSRPTFQGKEKRVESHIFNFDRDVYGEFVRVHFQKRVRGEMKFSSTDTLVNQIKNDILSLKKGDK